MRLRYILIVFTLLNLGFAIWNVHLGNNALAVANFGAFIMAWTSRHGV